MSQSETNQSTPARAEASEGGDPWQAVEYALTPLLQAIDGPVVQSIRCRIDDARAAVEAAHRQEIERLTQERDAVVRLNEHDTARIVQLEAEIARLTTRNEELETAAMTDDYTRRLERRMGLLERQVLEGGEERERLSDEVDALAAQMDAFWQMVESGWDIEPRAYFEAEAAKMGYGSPLAMAAHHMWKRELKDSPLAAQIAGLREALEQARRDIDMALALMGQGGTDPAAWMGTARDTLSAALAATEGGTK